MAGRACLLRQDGDLGERLRDHAEEDVVADLHDARELALADVADPLAQGLQVRERLLIGGPAARDDDAEPSSLDHLAVSTDRRGQQGAARRLRGGPHHLRCFL